MSEIGFTVTPDTWLISDTHLGHKNIVKYCNRPMNHNELMLKAWRGMIQPEDTVLHLGDLAVWYGEDEEYWLREAMGLPGKKFMLRGNHDKLKDARYAELGFPIIPEFVQEIKGQRVLFSHYPDEDRTSKWDINVHGHIHNNLLEPRLASSGRRYKNISVELTDYKPIKAKELLVFE
jgi:calcineurin-like phosphoesterase family protein